MSEGEQILIARDDDVGAAGLRGFDEAVVVGVADKLDGLRGVTTMAARARSSMSLCASPMTACSAPPGATATAYRFENSLYSWAIRSTLTIAPGLCSGASRGGSVPTPPNELRSVARHTALGGGAFSALFVVGLVLLLSWPLQLGFPDQQWVAWYENGRNQVRQLVGLLLVVASSFAFVVFVAGFLHLTDDTDSRGPSSWVALAAAVLFAAMAMLGSMTLAAVSLVVAFGPDISATPDADVMRFLTQAGTHGLLGLGGGWSAAVCLAALSVRARRSGVLPQRLVTAGFVAAVLLLAGPAFVPLVVLALWVAAAAIVLRRFVKNRVTP